MFFFSFSSASSPSNSCLFSIADRNDALGLEAAAAREASAQEATAGAVRERDAAWLVEAAEATELNLQDAGRRGEEAWENCDRRQGEVEEGVSATLGWSRAEAGETWAEVAMAAAVAERRRAKGAEAHASPGQGSWAGRGRKGREGHAAVHLLDGVQHRLPPPWWGG